MSDEKNPTLSETIASIDSITKGSTNTAERAVEVARQIYRMVAEATSGRLDLDDAATLTLPARAYDQIMADFERTISFQPTSTPHHLLVDRCKIHGITFIRGA